ncbi:hypothetical protein GSI_07804 [Ganoderma sinense ZZ0214-1]|uniref:Uncharacterized protein n=1 Tax=Ganoderma sinense ZZ0214-1 TaxID=1077348 RepID=A0A2G8S8X1_9APHY|nr:hypothetical protein GSI_07629 [Ganoderma sinense ZZ0214-1]PIL30226.1 hypothetical protein GSI_07804 [Ganoderma sinense ZZ0214-1]
MGRRNEPDRSPHELFSTASVEPDHAKRYPYAHLAEPPNPPAGRVLYTREDSAAASPPVRRPAGTLFLSGHLMWQLRPPVAPLSVLESVRGGAGLPLSSQLAE